jgi:hypothetical protein
VSNRIKVGQLYGCKCAPMEFPMGFFAPHEDQAQRNHGQSLGRLAERGGLGLGEAIAILNGNDQRYLDCPKNEEWLKRRFARWDAAQRIEARSDETPAEAVQPEGREPGPKDAPDPSLYPSKEGKND